MKAKSLFQRVTRIFLMIVILGNVITIPDQVVVAKPLSGAFTNCAAQTQIPVTECDALVALYNNTNGAGWTDHTGWRQTDMPCSWFGVTCDVGTNVTRLGLEGNALSGPIPPELGNLRQLTRLWLNVNHLTGSIPAELGSLAELTDLWLNANALTGSIPPELGNLTNLTTLWLPANALSGSIPPQLGNLTNLTLLLLNDNALSGPIPTQLGNLTQLVDLRLNDNALSGSIPTQFGNLAQLEYLLLNNNQLSGPVPAQLGNLTSLTYLELGNNALSGSIPSELGNLTQLSLLGLYANALSGSIPAELGNLPNLTTLWLNHNALSGSIPAQLGRMMKLAYLALGVNQLTGSIPPELGNLAQLSILDLHDNHLSGSLPAQLGNMTNLWQLDLSHNALSGSLPAQLGSLTKLTTLYLGSNQLAGAIPASIVRLTSLAHLSLSCGLTSSNPAVIAFIDARLPGWQNNACFPIVTFTSIGAQDGWVLESSETSGAGSAINSSAAALNLGDDAARKQYRSILSFNTGILPDNAVVAKVTLKVRRQGVTGGGNPVVAAGGFMVDIKSGFFGATPTLQSADFQAATGKSCGPFKPALVNSWYTFGLTGAGPFINKLATGSGLTQIRLRFKLDDNNDAVANVLSLFSGNAPAASRPQLIVQYYVP